MRAPAPRRVAASDMGSLTTGTSRWGRRGAAAFIALWLSIQVLVPWLQKFPPPDFQYRWARYSWGMFSFVGSRYEVRLFRTADRGDTEPIPEMGRYVRGYRSPEPMRLRTVYWSEAEVLDRFSRLVSFIARDRRDGYTYVASIQWTRPRRGDQSAPIHQPAQSEIRVHAAP
jgi:hypothetical protein